MADLVPGFATAAFRLDGKRAEEVFEAPAGSRVEVGLPVDHPELPAGAAIYCSSSQPVKRLSWLRMSFRSNSACRSRATSMRNGPSVSTV